MDKPIILHIAQDQKFINAAHYLFEQAFPGLNKFIIVKSPSNSPNRYFRGGENVQYEIKSIDTVNKLALMSNHCSVTVLHSLDKVNGSVFLKSAKKNRFMTIIYGAEIYNRPKIIGEEVIGEKTKKLFESTQKQTLLDGLKDIYRKIVYKNYGDIEDIDTGRILYEMSVFGSFPNLSYDKYIENEIYNPSVKKIPFSYYPIEFIIQNEGMRARGSDILFGNSAWPSNNHLEGFDLLNNIELGGRTIFTPLSYGPPKYAKAIEFHGKRQFGGHFKALTTFLPLEEYNQLLSRCGIVIMNHYRPQAMGNIIASLYMGAKVLLNDTEAYRYLKQLGCNIYLIEDDLIGQKNAFQLLTDEQVDENRQALKNELSTRILVDKMRASFRDIFDFDENYLEAV